jgi:GDP-L-fucose synthase
MTVLVTGSSGLVGTALKEFINEDVFFATRDDADLTSFNQTLDLFQRIKPSKVIHLAALVGGIGGNLMHSGDYFRNNILINANVLEAARILEVNRLISFMSTCVFPNEGPYPLKVENLHYGQPHPSNFGYAYAKRMLEVQSRAYRAQWGCEYVVAVPTNIYGPGDNFNLTEGHVVPALIHKTFLAHKNNEPITIWGSGKPLREFVYSHDIARLILWMLENYTSAEPLILSSGIETSISELVTKIVETIGFDGEIRFDSQKPDGQFRKPSDTETFFKLNPKFDFTSLNEGLVYTIEWFKRNYPNIRA